MPLDSEIVAILKELECEPPMESLPVDVMRARLTFPSLEKRTAVGQVIEIQMPLAGRVLGARVYRPVVERSRGAIAYFHGGGFVIGNLDSHDQLCRDLCVGSGATLISVDYRLAPEHRFPAAIDDCLDAVRWIAQHAKMLSIDPTKIVVAGDSAGGNLATVTALQIRDKGGPDLRAQALIYPVTDYHTPANKSYIENQSGYSLTRAAMIRFWSEYLADAQEARHPYACPLRAPSLEGLPPALVVTAEFDPLRDEGEAYADRVCNAGVPVTRWRYDGMIHGFFRMSAACARAKEAVNRSAAWIGDAMER
ncbi:MULTISPECIES: alpha/beta hydrolase [unclassified Burkholderia]|uniref:alpha/beta hydrolase n=1 Tax=unclassified Burkholderia TaxID=2613784 RepID=UPI00214FF8B7|nr:MULTISPECIES: alpha/beta hydrolase [unclassified Burkholderia]MCR4471859.1 alpha/beta hydrolase [Burkholderia sp. SCN-KJ]